MKVGVMMALFADRPLAAALDRVRDLGAEMVELGTGAYPGDSHVQPAALLEDAAARAALLQQVSSRGLGISALSCHGNPVHPNPDIAAAHDAVFRSTVRLAAALEVDTVITFSGQPGSPGGGPYPNWVTQAWPPEFLELLEWQWKERVGPYWMDAAAFAAAEGVRVAIELHPGFIAYNTASFWRLRAEAGSAGDNLYVNFDPSHLFWQGMDPVACIDEMGPAIAHVHAKDTGLHAGNIRLNGVLDTAPYGDVADRSWIFRSLGYGHDLGFWRDLVSHLRIAGYDGTISIEHEDALMSVEEGLVKAYGVLRAAIIGDPPPVAWWT